MRIVNRGKEVIAWLVKACEEVSWYDLCAEHYNALLENPTVFGNKLMPFHQSEPMGRWELLEPYTFVRVQHCTICGMMLPITTELSISTLYGNEIEYGWEDGDWYF